MKPGMFERWSDMIRPGIVVLIVWAVLVLLILWPWTVKSAELT